MKTILQQIQNIETNSQVDIAPNLYFEMAASFALGAAILTNARYWLSMRSHSPRDEHDMEARALLGREIERLQSFRATALKMWDEQSK